MQRRLDDKSLTRSRRRRRRQNQLLPENVLFVEFHFSLILHQVGII